MGQVDKVDGLLAALGMRSLNSVSALALFLSVS